MTEPTTATIRAWHTHMESGLPDWHDLAGILLDRLQELEYRHECLKSLYADEMNYLDDDIPAIIRSKK